MIYAGFEIILVPEDNKKGNPNESYTNKYQKYIACNYGYELTSAEDRFKPFKWYLSKDGAYIFISSIIEKTKNDNEYFENSIFGLW